MKNCIYFKSSTIILVFTLLSFNSFSQDASFENGTLQGWTNSDESTTNLFVQNTGGAWGSTSFMIKECDGSNSVAGEMTVRYSSTILSNWSMSSPIFSIRNTNSFDLFLRVGYEDNQNNMVVSNQPIIIPAFSDSWEEISLGGNLTVVQGNASVTDVISNVENLYILHNPDLSPTGAYENGTLEIDEIYIVTLGIDDLENDSFVIFPNPGTDIISVQSKKDKVDSIVIKDMTGKIILKINYNFNNIDVSSLLTGLYLIEVKSKDKSQTIKLIKD
mgnify:CR=1 FL=1